MWNQHREWKAAEEAWDAGAREAAARQPIKRLKQLPQMPGITPQTAKHLKWKSLRWMIVKDQKKAILKGFFQHPLRYGWRLVKSAFQNKPYRKDGDFFLYGIQSTAEFEESLKDPNAHFIVGFSYCHKPFECPSGRFTDQCLADPANDVCRQCFIGKAMHALPEKNSFPLVIPTIHYIGEKIFEIVHRHPDKKVLFLITACEMTLEMFGDWGNMAGIRGIGVRLDGRICNTMEAFALSEEGIKPGLTVVLDDTQRRFLRLLQLRRECVSKDSRT